MRSEHKQKANQEKCEHVSTSTAIKEIIAAVKNERRRKLNHDKDQSLKAKNDSEKKLGREIRRNEIKIEVEKEDRTNMPTSRDRAKKEHVDSQAL